MKHHILLGAQILLGLIYFVLGGLNGFFQFIPMPEELPESVMKFFEGMMATGYLFYFVKGTELVFGFFLLVNIFARISLIILAPITLNIFLLILFTDPVNLPMSVAMLLLHLLAASRYCELYKTLFTVR